MKGSYLIIRREALKVDGWTYGDWRQYVAFLDNGDACCVRISALPFVLAMVGFVALCLPAMALFFWWQGVDVAWTRVGVLAFIGFCLLGPEAVLAFTTWRLCVIVGTATKRSDGSWERDL
jgi:hypothetical protein